MIFAQSREGRRFIGRLDKGDDFFEALQRVCRQHDIRCAEIRAFGSFESVTLNSFDQEEKRYGVNRRLNFPYSVLHLTGNISYFDDELMINVSTLLSWQHYEQITVLGGHLVAAKVCSIEFVIESFDDLMLWREMDSRTGLPLWARMEKRDPSASVDLALIASFEEPGEEERSEPLEPFVEYELVIGDFLEHPRLGRCEIVQIDGDERCHIRLENRRIVVLSLVVCTLQLTGTEGGRKIYTVNIKKRN